MLLNNIAVLHNLLLDWHSHHSFLKLYHLSNTDLWGPYWLQTGKNIGSGLFWMSIFDSYYWFFILWRFSIIFDYFVRVWVCKLIFNFLMRNSFKQFIDRLKTNQFAIDVLWHFAHVALSSIDIELVISYFGGSGLHKNLIEFWRLFAHFYINDELKVDIHIITSGSLP